MVDVESQVLLDGGDRQRRAADGVGGVDLVGPLARDVHHGVARNREPCAGQAAGPHQQDRVGAAGLAHHVGPALAGARRPRVRSQHQDRVGRERHHSAHVQRPLGGAGGLGLLDLRADQEHRQRQRPARRRRPAPGSETRGRRCSGRRERLRGGAAQAARPGEFGLGAQAPQQARARTVERVLRALGRLPRAPRAAGIVAHSAVYGGRHARAVRRRRRYGRHEAAGGRDRRRPARAPPRPPLAGRAWTRRRCWPPRWRPSTSCGPPPAAAIDRACFGIPSTIDRRRGVAVQAVNLDLFDVAFADVMSDRLGLAVSADNDANLAALGEQRAGAARGARHVVMLTVGTGIGGGLVLDGSLLPRLAGRRGRAGPHGGGDRRSPLPGRLPEPRLPGGRGIGHRAGARGARLRRRPSRLAARPGWSAEGAS